MGKGKPYSDQRKQKEATRFNIIDDGIDQRLEHESRVKMAEDDLRTYFVDKSMEERAAARQAIKNARREEAIATRVAAAGQEAVPAPAAPLEALADPVPAPIEAPAALGLDGPVVPAVPAPIEALAALGLDGPVVPAVPAPIEALAGN